jgi:hypothetical protein
MILKSTQSGRKIKLEKEDEKFYYFSWIDTPDSNCRWMKNWDVLFYEYFTIEKED